MRHTMGLISVSLLTLASANSFAVGGLSAKGNTPDRVTGVRIDRFIGIQAARPDNPALRISRRVIDHVDEQLANNSKAATAGIKPRQRDRTSGSACRSASATPY